MRNRGQMIIGGGILIFGLLLLIGAVFNIDFEKVCWPVGLILLGLFLLFQSRLFGRDSRIKMRLLGSIRRSGELWQVGEEEYWIIVGDIRLDMTQAAIPAGETLLRAYGFVGDIHLDVPQDVGVLVSSTAFLTSAKLWGQKKERFLSTVEENTPGYESAERKIRLETVFFVADIKIKQG